MTQITLDAASIAQLQSLAAPTEVCDSSGKVLGTYIPAAESADDVVYNRPPLSDEEYQRRMQEPARPSRRSGSRWAEHEIHDRLARSAEADLADYWTRARDRQSVADAADEIERVLRVHGPNFGKIVAVGVRRLVVLPLSRRLQRLRSGYEDHGTRSAH